MKNREMQLVWAAAGFYDGGIDGVLGIKAHYAIQAIRSYFGQYYSFPRSRINRREQIASVQACLNSLGFEAGHIDGLLGHNSIEALNAFLYFTAHNGKREIILREVIEENSISKIDLPHQNDVDEYYGDPNDMQRNLVQIKLPFSLRLDWSLRRKTRKITVHQKCSATLEKALLEVHEHYGLDTMKELGIDRYAGAYNKRKMRGSTSWSMHAYGCAIDFYARPNGLRVRCPDALFCRSEYKPFLDIMKRNGWLPAIRLWGADAMHFQAARL